MEKTKKKKKCSAFTSLFFFLRGNIVQLWLNWAHRSALLHRPCPVLHKGCWLVKSYFWPAEFTTEFSGWASKRHSIHPTLYFQSPLLPECRVTGVHFVWLGLRRKNELSCFVGGFNLVVHCGLPANVQVLDHTSAVTLQSLFTTLTTTTQPNIKSSKSAKIEHDYETNL